MKSSTGMLGLTVYKYNPGTDARKTMNTSDSGYFKEVAAKRLVNANDIVAADRVTLNWNEVRESVIPKQFLWFKWESRNKSLARCSITCVKIKLLSGEVIYTTTNEFCTEYEKRVIA